MKVSEHFFAIFTEPSTSDPTGFCYVEMDGKGKLQCYSKSICLHLHVLFCTLKIPDQQQESSCSSASSTAIDTATDLGLSVSRTLIFKTELGKNHPTSSAKSLSMHTGCRHHDQHVSFLRHRFVIFVGAPYQMDNVILARDKMTCHTY